MGGQQTANDWPLCSSKVWSLASKQTYSWVQFLLLSSLPVNQAKVSLCPRPHPCLLFLFTFQLHLPRLTCFFWVHPSTNYRHLKPSPTLPFGNLPKTVPYSASTQHDPPSTQSFPPPSPLFPYWPLTTASSTFYCTEKRRGMLGKCEGDRNNKRKRSCNRGEENKEELLKCRREAECSQIQRDCEWRKFNNKMYGCDMTGKKILYSPLRNSFLRRMCPKNGSLFWELSWYLLRWSIGRLGWQGSWKEVPEVRKGAWRGVGVDSDRGLNQRCLKMILAETGLAQ